MDSGGGFVVCVILVTAGWGHAAHREKGLCWAASHSLTRAKTLLALGQCTGGKG